MLKGIEQAAAFILFELRSLERPYCQLEIRHAMALKKPIVLLHGERLLAVLVRVCLTAVCLLCRRSLFLPSSACLCRVGREARPFDFRAAHAARRRPAAAARQHRVVALQEEGLRARRDAQDRAGAVGLPRGLPGGAAGAGAKAEALAPVPVTIAHVLLDALFERPAGRGHRAAAAAEGGQPLHEQRARPRHGRHGQDGDGGGSRGDSDQAAV